LTKSPSERAMSAATEGFSAMISVFDINERNPKRAAP
jgi:hypothetical protein